MDQVTFVTTLYLAVVIPLSGWLTIRRIDRVEAKLDAKIELRPTRDEVHVRLDRLESEVASLRSDLTHVALAVGARSRPQTG